MGFPGCSSALASRFLLHTVVCLQTQDNAACILTGFFAERCKRLGSKGLCVCDVYKHTHTYIYIYIYTCMRMCKYRCRWIDSLSPIPEGRLLKADRLRHHEGTSFKQMLSKRLQWQVLSSHGSFWHEQKLF